MNRSDKTFREQTTSAERDLDFLDDLFNELFDQEVNEDSDKVPNLSLVR